ncbi:hypothetical protein SPI_06062 [Niveomyces insectorum RCEF 264]|uniref:HNH nuclease domain-containing protein n=1 Tax=Niveomyces insectorum RCEF 264 TaxID=1081102 RepID=A0A167SRK9_9HYPO|nr:hypothetical protein SPI_06062 [Niveomyces insectorum RCEF 264]
MRQEDVLEVSGPTISASATQVSDVVQRQAAQLSKAFTAIRREQAVLEEKLDHVTNAIVILDAKWTEGAVGLGQGDYQREREKLLALQLQLMSSVSVLRTTGSELAGRWTDEAIIGSRQTHDDWTTIDSTIRLFPHLAHAQKSVKARRQPAMGKRFRAELIKAYGAEDELSDDIWCPVSQKYIEKSVAVAAHIVKFNIGELVARALFGEDEKHIWNSRNGLVLHKNFKRLLDEAKAVILPASDAEDETDFIFFLLDQNIGRLHSRVTAEDLHGRKLQFLTEFRPRKRYLYFKFVMSLLRRRRGEVPGFLDDLERLPSPGKALWCSPGPYLKQSILYKFSRQLGCLSEDEANKFWGVQDTISQAVSGDDEDLAKTLSTKATIASMSTAGRKTKKRQVRGKNVRKVSDDDEDEEEDEGDDKDEDEDEDSDEGDGEDKEDDEEDDREA